MYNNGYGNFYPYNTNYMPKAGGGTGLLGGLLGITGKINWNGILNGTSKTLGTINQIIPIVHQVRPIINNAKTMFKIAGALKDEPSQKKEKNVQKSNISNSNTVSNQNTSNNNYQDLNTVNNYTDKEQVVSNRNIDNSPTFFI